MHLWLSCDDIFTGSFPQICEILRFCDFFIVLSCPILVIIFFSQLRPDRTPGRNVTIYGLNDASSPKDVPFGGLDDDPQYKGVQKTPKCGVVRRFSAKLAKFKKM